MKSGRFAIIPARAIDDKRMNAAAVLVLAALGTYGDRDGWCWPSMQTLAERLGVTRQAISKQIQELVKLGYLDVQTRKREDGGTATNAYRIVHDRDLEEAPPQLLFAGGAQQEVAPPQRDVAAPATSEVAPIRTYHKNDTSKDDLAGFAEWYAAYPRKQARGDAERAYRKALKTATPAELMAGLDRWKANYTGDRKYIPYPASWLNDKRWMDEDGSAAPAGPAAPVLTLPMTEEAEWGPRIDGWNAKRFWLPHWGPKPGERGCRVPQQLLNRVLAA